MLVFSAMGMTLGLYSVPFGYGPVSKAAAITRAINNRSDTKWRFVCADISREYLVREGFQGSFLTPPSIDVDETIAQQLITETDGVIVVMHRGWANRLAPFVPVFFVDSLGFMWARGAFDSFPGFSRLCRYYVQDLFGSYRHLEDFDLPALCAVPPIISTSSAYWGVEPGRFVIHLGGLHSPFGNELTSAFLIGMRSLLTQLNHLRPLILTSEIVLENFSNLFDGIDARSVCHEQAIALIGESSFTLSAPGLTTLLEMARLSVPTCPLPPENYSQLLNVRKMVSEFGERLPDVWHFLDLEYACIPSGLPEKEGVFQTAQHNRMKLISPAFQRRYVDMIQQSIEQKPKLPTSLAGKGNGAEFIASDVISCLQSTQIRN